MNINASKVLAMLGLGLGSFISGMLPAWFSPAARQRCPLFLSCLLCFGGGVLLSTSLAHMLPEAREKLPDYAEVTLCLGFFLVFFVDELVHVFYGKKLERQSAVVETGTIASHRYGSVEETSLLRPVASAPHEDDHGRLSPCCGDTGNPRMCHVSHKEPCNKSSSGMVGLLAALFLHSLLEGLAIGLQESSNKVLLLLGAVASHKFVVGFCLGVELADSFSGRIGTHIINILVFSLGSVGGIALGTGLDDVKIISESSALPIMQALAAGTLLYVTVSEVLPRERARWHESSSPLAGLCQFLAAAIGAAVMYLLTVLLDHDDSIHP